VIYLDSSAILKLLRREAETDALVEHLDAHLEQELITSVLATVEVARALTAIGAAEVANQAVRRSGRIHIGDSAVPAVALAAGVLDLARALPRPCSGRETRSTSRPPSSPATRCTT
jgi:predicted nucleic acid-binding protein